MFGPGGIPEPYQPHSAQTRKKMSEAAKRMESERSRLADDLFRAVELEQGFAFISDGLDVLSDEDIVAIARGSLYHSRRVVRILEKWLAKHGHLTDRRMLATGSGKTVD